MLFWFVACGVFAVFFVFDSPAVDYRFVLAGSVLPLLEAVSGSPWVLHTLLGSVAALMIVMAATARPGLRLVRRRWLGIPIGLLVFLAASGSWSRTALFWWPLGGSGGPGEGRPPEFDRPVGLIVVLEVIGVVAVVWLARRLGLGTPENRRQFLTSGRMPRRPAG